MVEKKIREKNRLERIASWYKPGQERIENIYLGYLSDTIIPRIKGPKVLEMGCSGGLMTAKLARRFLKLTVVDGSSKYIDCSKKLVGDRKVNFIISLFENFETEERFDDIIMSHILEHVENPVSVLKRAKKLLKDKGKIHIAVPNARSLHRMIGQKMGLIKRLDELTSNDQKMGHRRIYDKDSLKKDIKKAGLKVVGSEGVFLKPLSAYQIKNWDKNILDAFSKVAKSFSDYCSTIYFICKK